MNRITSTHIDQLNRLSFYWSICPEQYSPQPELANNMTESNTRNDLATSSAQPLPRDRREQTSHTNRAGEFINTGKISILLVRKDSTLFHLDGNSNSEGIDEHMGMNRPNIDNSDK